MRVGMGGRRLRRWVAFRIDVKVNASSVLRSNSSLLPIKIQIQKAFLGGGKKRKSEIDYMLKYSSVRYIPS